MQARIGCIQMTSTSDVEQNLQMAEKWIAEAAKQKANLVVLPEMFAMMSMDQGDKIRLQEQYGTGRIQDFLREAALKHHIWIVGGTLPIVSHDPNRARAACLVYNDQGECVARYDKVHLFDVHLHASQENYSESKTIEPGDKVVVLQTPFGRLGFAVCYDLRFPELFRRMNAQAVDIIIVPTAFTYTTGIAHWEVLVRARAIENLAYVATACQTGIHPGGRRTYGHSMIVNPWGVIEASLQEEQGVIVSDLNLADMHKLRKDFPVLLHQKL